MQCGEFFYCSPNQGLEREKVMKKKIFMSAAKKARIALTVMAVCGFTVAGAQSAFAADPSPTTEHPVKIDADKNIICGEGATASNDPIHLGQEGV
mgnify:FL=1